MARGSLAKQEIMKKILETFDGSFSVAGKDIYIPFVEDGVELQIKIAMTCPKALVSPPDGQDVPEKKAQVVLNLFPTDEEIADLQEAIKSLNN